MFPRTKSFESSSAFPAISLGFTSLGEIFAYVALFSFLFFSFFLSNHRGSHIPSSWMVHAGCVLLLAFTHPESFESVL